MQATEAFELGAGYLEKKQLDKALVAFSEAIRLEPKFAHAYHGRGVVFALEGETDKALADCCEAIRLNPDDAEFYRTRAYVYEQMGDQAKADADFAKAKELEGAE
jgi:Flp pilus assembly protein TadD